jgi:RNA polymerase sigma factor (sigma-70 family)
MDRCSADVADLADLVAAAADGDGVAAGALVRRFERYATAYATTLLDGDVHLARDAVQDAFIEALDHLDRLADPAAFPGWLRPIVRKRADRIRRRRRDRPAGIAAGAADEPSRGGSGDPHDVVAVRERAASVRAALRTARPRDRAVLGLHYLAGWSYADIAEGLGLPLSTVRKRLHDARRRLAVVLERDPDEAEAIAISDAVAFLHALRNVDLDTAAQLLAADRRLTGLVEPEGRISHRGRLIPVRPGYHPLHRAAATGNRHLLRLLVDYGADPRAADDAGETPLHTAALYGHIDAATQLLRAGADPAAPTVDGLTPRHWALLRRHHRLAELLADAGADRPTPCWIADRSDERNAVMPADPTNMLGRVLTVDGAPLDDGPPVQPPVAPAGALTEGQEPLATGIRVIDVCAPVVRGGTVELRGPEGAGQLVVVAEIVHGLAQRGGASVQCGIAQRAIGAATDIRDGIAPMGLQPCVAAVLVEEDAKPHRRAQAVRQAIDAAHTLAEDRDVLLLIDRAVLDDPAVALGAAGLSERGSVTVAIITTAAATDTAAIQSIDCSLVFGGDLAAAGVLPAISPTASSSRLLDAVADPQGAAAAEAVRQAAAGARQLRDFLRQPFHVAEPWSGQPGETTGRDEALRRARTLV